LTYHDFSAWYIIISQHDVSWKVNVINLLNMTNHDKSMIVTYHEKSIDLHVLDVSWNFFKPFSVSWVKNRKFYYPWCKKRNLHCSCVRNGSRFKNKKGKQLKILLRYDSRSTKKEGNSFFLIRFAPFFQNNGNIEVFFSVIFTLFKFCTDHVTVQKTINAVVR